MLAPAEAVASLRGESDMEYHSSPKRTKKPPLDQKSGNASGINRHRR